MAREQRGQAMKNLERRVDAIEQILPTLATKADLQVTKSDLRAAIEDVRDELTASTQAAIEAAIQTAIAPLATRADLAPLATRAEIDLLATRAEVALLPTRAEIDLLATRAEVALLATREEVALLATRDELAPLATRAEVKAEGETTRRYFDVVAESLRGDIRLIAEGLASSQVNADAGRAEIARLLIQHDARLTDHDIRLTRLESER